MDEFIIKSTDDDCTLVFLEREPENTAEPALYFRIKVTRSDLSATARVWAESVNPIEWFHDLADNWDGWRGERIWNSLERELALIATRDRFGHITMRIELRAGLMERDWMLRAFVVVDAGQLEGLARQAERFFGKEEFLR